MLLLEDTPLLRDFLRERGEREEGSEKQRCREREKMGETETERGREYRLWYKEHTPGCRHQL